jgi:U-box domain
MTTIASGESEQIVEMTTTTDERDDTLKVTGEVHRDSYVNEARPNVLSSEDGAFQDAVTPVYPKTFYCPLSGSLLHDPVVSPDGISYERAALELRGDDMSKVYENRSLKTIIDDAVDLQSSSKPTGTRLGNHVSQRSQYSLNANHRPLPEGFYCPITLGLIHAPVIDPEGYSYEKVAIENWIKCKGASPVTRRAMTIDVLYPNTTLTMLMTEEKNKSHDQIHPAFKLWSEEPLPNVPDVLPSVPDVDYARDPLSDPPYPTAFLTAAEELAARDFVSRDPLKWVLCIYMIWALPSICVIVWICGACVLLGIGCSIPLFVMLYRKLREAQAEARLILSSSIPISQESISSVLPTFNQR